MIGTFTLSSDYSYAQLEFPIQYLSTVPPEEIVRRIREGEDDTEDLSGKTKYKNE